MIKTLNFPSGEFTHTELATFNGQTNQQVWTRYQQAIKDGVIVSAGTRPSAGKGKPSKLWKLATGQPIPVVAPTPSVPAPVTPPVVAPTVPTEAIVVPAAAPAPVVVPEPVKLPEATPAAAPVVEAPVVVEVLKIEAPKTEPATTTPPVVVERVVKDARTITEVCPICGKPLSAINDATGVMVWCAQPPEICSSAENPYGHGDSDKKAYEKLCEKFDRQPTRATA